MVYHTRFAARLNLLIPPLPEVVGFSHYTKEQQTDEWYDQYAYRAGIESTFLSSHTNYNVAKTPYRGTSKTHLHNLLATMAEGIIKHFSALSAEGTKHKTARYAGGEAIPYRKNHDMRSTGRISWQPILAVKVVCKVKK